MISAGTSPPRNHGALVERPDQDLPPGLSRNRRPICCLLESASPNTRCLQYRERHYDDKGLLVGTPGEWKPLTVNIEGFTIAKASACGTPSKLYVLDLVVESQVVKKPH